MLCPLSNLHIQLSFVCLFVLYSAFFCFVLYSVLFFFNEDDDDCI